MVDVVHPRCQHPSGCEAYARWGDVGKRTVHCAKHKKDTAVPDPRQRCKAEACRAVGTYADPDHGERFCDAHAEAGHWWLTGVCDDCGLHWEWRSGVPVVLTPAEGKIAGQRRPLRNRCVYCDPVVFNNHRHREEWKVAAALQKVHGARWTLVHDRRIHGGECVASRPDFIIYTDGAHVVIIEVDEHQHRSYDQYCELVRLFNLGQSCEGLPLLVIRYNPHSYRSSGGELVHGGTDASDEQRQAVLLSYVTASLDNSYNPHERKPKVHCRAVKLFYDGWDDDAMTVPTDEGPHWLDIQLFDRPNEIACLAEAVIEP
eukprot:jgi/Mesvir1/21294/Mv25979-RA.1